MELPGGEREAGGGGKKGEGREAKGRRVRLSFSHKPPFVPHEARNSGGAGGMARSLTHSLTLTLSLTYVLTYT